MTPSASPTVSASPNNPNGTCTCVDDSCTNVPNNANYILTSFCDPLGAYMCRSCRVSD